MHLAPLLLPPSLRGRRGLVKTGLRLTPAEVPRAAPGPAEVRVRVRASALSGVDLLRADGAVVGAEIAGEVVQDRAGFTAGERVFALIDPLRGGGCVEEVAVEAGALVRIPSRLSFEEAAAVPLAAVAAHEALDAGALVPGERVLIVGAAGGVGSFAVQLAAAAGCEVTAVCSSRDTAFVLGLGAAHAVERDEVRGAFDLLVDAAGALDRAAGRRLLAPHGVHVSLDAGRGARVQDAVLHLAPGPRFRVARVRASGALLASIAYRLEAGTLRSTLARVYGVERASPALEHLASGRGRGKVVLQW